MIEKVLTDLMVHRLQSDERFAENYVRMRKNRGFGPITIITELYERGIQDELINKYIDSYDEMWFVHASKVHTKKFGNKIPADYSERVKQMKFLQYRGFTHDHIKRIVGDNYEE